MTNERLRAAMLERGLTLAAFAEAIGVDEKTIERWITQGRTPYRRHRYAAATHLGVEETYLWPDAISRQQVATASESEIVNIYPHRWAMPRDTWGRLFSQAEEEIGILVYVALFLAEDTGIQRLLEEKARAGVRVRVLLGEPDGSAVAQRGEEEGIGDAIGAKARNAIALYRPLRQIDGVEFRLHDTILYNSIYRADDELLVNTHVYGNAASNAPVFHLRGVAGGDMVALYRDSFERVWDGAKPLTGG
ncbi:XRE family transcriptional regulator [Actinomadura sp. DC4]|uniref:XRE family transcriptional regulator n=1 Tax=Actinomadura sp. DC4 TaxID=3055069 RepID=UPI0025B26656|nr:XRE family transcriptional regulator [Actinomadura sp. DC4]MDN3355849.1 XRE family transcriptional regulator [Actinomadura sp. DC4]